MALSSAITPGVKLSAQDADIRTISPGIRQAPLVHVAAAVTIGIMADRSFSVPPAFSLALAGLSLVAWAIARRSSPSGVPLIYLGLASVGIGAAYHHSWQNDYAADDIANFATPEPKPVRVRGVLVDEPVIYWREPDDPLRSIPHPDPTLATLQTTEVCQQRGWIGASGLLRLRIGMPLEGIHVGDHVEVVGRIESPRRPANPGEHDFGADLRDHRIRAVLEAAKTSEAVQLLDLPPTFQIQRALMRVRGWGQRTLAQALQPEQSGVAAALLLGEGSTMTSEGWQRYIRTGAVHILAISGQHLMILAAFLWLLLRSIGVRRRPAILAITIFIFAYATLTGGRPPAIRAAVTIAAGAGALWMARIPVYANSLAIAWLVVLLINPTDITNAGCQLSFVAVAALYLALRKPVREVDPIIRLIQQSLPPWRRALKWMLGFIAGAYAATWLIWLTTAPLVAAHYHLLSPIGLLLGPPMLLLTLVCLISGFLLLVSAAVVPALVPIFAAILNAVLAAGSAVIETADRVPFGYFYIGDLPVWWLWGFYVLLLPAFGISWLRQRWRWSTAAGAIWLGLGSWQYYSRPALDELRVTFLAVGHGGCTVMETQEGQVLLYDAGTLGGPEVTRRIIAPFLWSRRIHRIDEVFISHADLDHFNGLPDLLDRFSVGRVSFTPTFSEKPIPGVPAALSAVQSHHIPTRIVSAGAHALSGPVTIDVIHPPAAGPEGNENSRSMVLLVRHAGHSLLLTGDLEAAGLDRVLSLPKFPVDILMGPHHGSRVSNTAALAQWAAPRLVILSQGSPRNPPLTIDPYTERKIPCLGTWPLGAITIHSRRNALTVDAFTSGEEWRVLPGYASSALSTLHGRPPPPAMRAP
jgi:competence protein ComEC